MTIRYDARPKVTLCIGEGCYQGRVSIVRAAGEELFAFLGMRDGDGRDEYSTLVTIHEGRTHASIGTFLGKGVVYSLMKCR